MALTSNISIDLGAKTASLTCTTSGNPVETVTFSNNRVTFSARANIFISPSDFLSLVDQLNILQTALAFNYSVNVYATLPFDFVGIEEQNDILNNIWTCIGVFGDPPNIVEYYAIAADNNVQLQTREGDKTIEFPEWIYLLYSLNHYKASVKTFLGA